MNVLTLVFSLLLILSYGFYASWSKQSAAHRIGSSYLGHQKVDRKILKGYQSEIYKQFEGTQIEQTKSPTKEKSKNLQSEEKEKKQEPNHSCSKINLFSLIQGGSQAHPALYDLVIKMLKDFYGPLTKGEKQFETRFLKAFLKAAGKGKTFAFEKLDLQDPHLQKFYYKMLKGTKQWDMGKKIGYPTLCDYIKIENSDEKICLAHAHFDVFHALFTPKVANIVFKKTTQEQGCLITKELICQAYSEAHQLPPDEKFFDLFQFKELNHKEDKKALIATDTKSQITLRKNVSLK